MYCEPHPCFVLVQASQPTEPKAVVAPEVPAPVVDAARADRTSATSSSPLPAAVSLPAVPSSTPAAFDVPADNNETFFGGVEGVIRDGVDDVAAPSGDVASAHSGSAAPGSGHGPRRNRNHSGKR